MSFLSGLFGGSNTTQTPSSSPTDTEFTSSADLFNATSFSSNVKGSSQSQGSTSPPSPYASSSSGSGSGSASGSGSFSASAAAASGLPAAPTALDTFSTAYDPAKLHPLAGLGDKLDFLQLDEDKLTEIQGAATVLPSRGWTDDLCVGTGTTYLSGLVVGGAWGMKEGLSRPLGNNASFRLRLNAILNGCTRRGSFTGNSLGVLAIFYNITNSTLDNYRGKHDAINAMIAGAVSGGIFKATAGVRPAMVGAGLMTAAAGSWSYLKTIV